MWKALYVRSRPDRSAMILKALQSKMKTSRNESLELIGSLSVEHLLPQQADLKDYPYASVDLDEDYTLEGVPEGHDGHSGKPDIADWATQFVCVKWPFS